MKKWIVLFGVMMILASSVNAQELVVNGQFSDELFGWTNSSHYMGNRGAYNGGIVIIDDNPLLNTLKMTGINSGNYYLIISQDIAVDKIYDKYEVSLDWKVTNKESTYGSCYIIFDFFDTSDERIGRIIVYDTAIFNGSPRHSLDKMRGPLLEGQFVGLMRLQEVFNWEHLTISTLDMPDFDVTQVKRINVSLNIQNDAGRGGEMLVDNISVNGSFDDAYQNGYNAGYAAGAASVSCNTGSTTGGALPTITANLDISIPELTYSTLFDSMNLWVKFKYFGYDQNTGKHLWSLDSFGEN